MRENSMNNSSADLAGIAPGNAENKAEISS
jgi:hypothetical protein